MKMEEYIESELTVIFRKNELVAKNIMPGSPGTQRQAVSAV